MILELALIQLETAKATWLHASSSRQLEHERRTYLRLLDEAVKSRDDAERYGLYGKAEARLTGPEGQFPYLPLYWIVYPILHKAKDVGLTNVVITQRCLPILRSRMNPSFSKVDRAPLNRKPAGTAAASSGYPSTVPPPRPAMRSSAPARAAVATP
jgi:hypothetical protein